MVWGIGGMIAMLAWVWTPLRRRAYVRSSRLCRGVRKRPRDRPLPPLDGAILADLMCAALSGGASIPSAMIALDSAVGIGSGLAIAAQILLLGGQWEEAWEHVDERMRHIGDALTPAWTDGASPVPLLTHSAASIRERRNRHARLAAVKLGEKVVLPLVICFLPAFVVLGVVPVIAAVGIEIFS